MDADRPEHKPATYADIIKAVNEKNVAKLKILLSKYHGDNVGGVDGLALLCAREYKDASSEIKVLLMTKVLSLSQKMEYVVTLNSFADHDVAKVISDVDFKARTALKNPKYKNISGVLEDFEKKERKRFGNTPENAPIAFAAFQGDMDTLRKRLEAPGSDINFLGKEALYFAVKAGRTEAVKYLLEKGAKVTGEVLKLKTDNAEIKEALAKNPPQAETAAAHLKSPVHGHQSQALPQQVAGQRSSRGHNFGKLI